MKNDTSYGLRINVLRELSDNFNYICKSFKYFKKLIKHKKKVVPAAQWIIDNLYLIEKEYKNIKHSMPMDYFRGLPKENCKLQKDKSHSKEISQPRIFIAAKNYINNGLKIKEEELIEYINRLQDKENDKDKFTMGELWAFSLMLRIAIIINLSKNIEKTVEFQKETMDREISSIESTSEILEAKIGEDIGNIRAMQGISWKKFFENTSEVERILRKDPEEIYEKMDFKSKDYYRHRLERISYVVCTSEVEIAREILEFSKKAKENNEESYKCHVGYYLIDDGIGLLREHYHQIKEVINSGTYIGVNLIFTFLAAIIVLAISLIAKVPFTKLQFIVTFCVILIPINEIVLSLINWTVSKSVPIRIVPKLDFSKGIPDNCKTVVVIPSIASSKSEIKELMSKLEVEYVGNKDKNLYFALLNDFGDCDSEHGKYDAEIIETGLSCARELNEKYCRPKDIYDVLDKYNTLDYKSKEDRFFFLNRKRIYNDKQKRFMGRERKRGKLMEFMALIRDKSDHSYDVISSDISVLKDVKYLITLDSDTFMPRECASKLIGSMEHVLNIPYIKKGRVIRGYGIMQPKVSINLESKNRSNFSKIFAGDGGVDGYSIAYSDTYQDLFGEGTFTGKGIINIDVFYESLNRSIKENSILSHDLLEGAFARCALVSDIEFIDDYPSSYKSSCKRLHRWIRGDWQLLGWIFSRKINLLNKWKIFDNIKRSLLAPNLLLVVILSVTMLKEKNSIVLLCFLAIISPLVFTVTDFVVTPKNKLMGTFKNMEQFFLITSFIPYQAYLVSNAVIKTLFRLFISRKNLLEWEPYSKSEKTCNNTFKEYIKMMWISPLAGLLIIYLSFINNLGIILFDLALGVLWIAAPYIAFKISCKLDKNNIPLSLEDKKYLRKVSRRIWAYYEDFVNEENNYLAPDNYQEKPLKGVAYRTSPTNIGMSLTANVAAYDLGYITITSMVDNIEKILNSMEKLQKEHGHYLNWYDTRSREPLWPRYISTVDNGNLLIDLWIVKQAMIEAKENEIIRTDEIAALEDIYNIIEDEDKSMKIRFIQDIKIGDYTKILQEILNKVNKNKSNKKSDISKLNNTEIEYWIDKLVNEVNKKINNYNYIFKGIKDLYSDDFLEGVPNINEMIKRIEELKEKYGDDFECTLTQKHDVLIKSRDRIDNIIKKIDKISHDMDFKFLYDDSRKLFYIGYNVEEKSLGNSYYDLLASEARGASFIGIAKNDIPSSHWFKLSREMTNAFHTHSLVSWSGTMFEYFMPALVMKSYPESLLSQTYKSVIKAQKSYCRQKKVPWGISEAAYHEFDVAENYQYKAFGIPGLGLKAGLEDELVVSPYSTLMVLPFETESALKNLKRLENLGTVGRYGFIESIDYTKSRQDNYVFKVQKTKDDILDNNHILRSKMIDGVTEDDDSDEIYEDINDDSIIEDMEYDNTDEEVYEDIRDNENYNELDDEVDDEEISEDDKISENLIYNDGIKPNNIRTYMVHHLGMSIMALDNVLNKNILINRFHSIPEVKATELLLKEKIPRNVTFERDEDFSIKNRYLEGENIIPRIFEDPEKQPCEILLLSNGMYSSMITSNGGGYSKNGNMMMYRWKGDSTSDDSGMFFYIKNLNSNDYWSAAYEPCRKCGEEYKAELSLDKAKFYRKDGSIETQMEAVISIDKNLEIRKLTLSNSGDSGRSLEITSYMEIILTSFEADAVHPAFSNLFVQTEYDKNNNILIGSRRGRSKNDNIPYVFHKVLINGESEGDITYETSRINFIGRNRDLKSPYVMENNKTLENTVGTVLDPIMSLRVRVRLEPGETKEVYYILGNAASRDDIIEICNDISNTSILERNFEKYTSKVQMELNELKIKGLEANIFQKLSSSILFLEESRENREKYIKNISKHQRDLWAYGISGDLPIIMLKVRSEDDSNLISNIIKFHRYIANNGLRSDLLIYNDEMSSYEEPLQKNIMNIITILNEGSFINSSGGIFIYNKASMDESMRDFIIGICRVYIDSEKGNSLDKIEEEMLKYHHHNNLEESAHPIESYRLEVTVDSNLDDNKIGINKNYYNDESIGSSIERDSRSYGEDNDYSEYDNDVDFINNYDLKEALDEPDSNIGNEEDIKIEDLDFFNGYGGFNKEDKSYVIRLTDNLNTPAPWINVISNDDFGFHISESGSSYTWCGNSRENKITPWSNDYIRDPLGEALYIRDNKDNISFSISPKPIRDDGEYIIKHGFGYSEFKHTYNGIKAKLEVFIPKTEKVKIQRITLKNISDNDKEISIFYYAQLVLGVYSYESSKYISTYIKDDNSYIGGINPYSEYFGKMMAYATIIGGENLSFTGDRREFIGRNKDLSSPEALTKTGLSNRCGSIYDPCLGCYAEIKLKKGECGEVLVLLGQDEEANIRSIIEKYSVIENAEKELKKAKYYWSEFLGRIQVKTCDKSIDYLLNGWLLYQTLSCRYLSRTAFYQSGGAYGFRDQLQDSMALGVVKPEITKDQILRSASRQYVEGDVQHWWHPVVNSGIRTRFSDDLLWLPYVTAEYINATGDYEILNEVSPYLEDEPLKAGEDERYTIVNQSSKKGTIYEHCLKAINHSLKFGSHNIPLMGSGDWNDGMSTVGNKGKGESVWLGWFLYSILSNFEEIARYMNDEETAIKYDERKEFIKENIEKNAWDGSWYRRAYFDDGTPLGSRENPECQIDSLAQSWAVISGAGKDVRIKEAMKAVDDNLVKKDKGMILLLTPPFDDSSLQPGYIKGYVPGVRENGGQYTHAAVWVILALTKLKLGNKAVNYYSMINPINHARSKLECMLYKVEPYVMSADVYIKEPHGGRGGWSWYTGASGWMYRVGIENILGIKKIKDKGYKIEPCIPCEWDKYEVKIKNSNEEYFIKVHKEKMLSMENVAEIKTFINGEEVLDNIIPRNLGKLNIDVYIK